ncbi:MAG: hypothetical protein IPI32_03710 [Austwickia sp.]|jgi:hypothetical protein|nr:hypothetical protein [Austwickia sp.]MBK8436741.1 hypothetical protein [Austwickia sp.]MBK9100371.1 hypothetical protein [Austwickia sp.]
MERRRPKLGAWWAVSAPLLAGWVVFVVANRRLVGGLLMASAFLVWGVLRLVLPDRPGLAVRSVPLDLITHVALFVNVAGAVMLTLRRVEWPPLAALDLALLVLAVIVIRRERRRRRPTPSP